MFGTIFLLAALISSTFAAATPCTFPDAWSGGADNEMYYRRDARGTGFDTVYIAYDAANQRTACEVESDIGSENAKNFTVIALFEKKTVYIFNTKEERCAAVNLERDFEKWGIPSDASNVDDYTTGALTETIHNEEWLKEFTPNKTDIRRHGDPPQPPKPEHVYWSMDVTSDHCVPVVEFVVAEFEEATYLVNNVFYYDIEATVDAKDFDIPSFCPGEAQEGNEDLVANAKKALSFSPAMKIF